MYGLQQWFFQVLPWSWPCNLSLVCRLRGLPGGVKVPPPRKLYCIVILPDCEEGWHCQTWSSGKNGVSNSLERVPYRSIWPLVMRNQTQMPKIQLTKTCFEWTQFCWADGPWHWRLRIAVKHQFLEGRTAPGDRREPTPALRGFYFVLDDDFGKTNLLWDIDANSTCPLSSLVSQSKAKIWIISRALRIFFKGGDNKALTKDGGPVQDLLGGAVKVVNLLLLRPPSPFICLVVATALRFLHLALPVALCI